MKIARITVWSVPLTSHETYYMASGKACATIDTIVLRVDTDAGLSGWGEVCPIPHYLPAYANGVVPAIAEIASVILGQGALGPEAVMARANAQLLDHRYAKSALDIALWDLTARAANMPLYMLLGGRQSNTLPVYHSITCINPDDMVRIGQRAFQSGVRQFQAKLGADVNWEADVAPPAPCPRGCRARSDCLRRLELWRDPIGCDARRSGGRRLGHHARTTLPDDRRMCRCSRSDRFAHET